MLCPITVSYTHLDVYKRQVLAGCAGPSTRVIVRSETGSNHELPEEIPVLEEVNPYYIQESLTVLSETSRYGGRCV